jgi:hypothetical protein
MQPLSKVNRKAVTNWGLGDAMGLRPKLAVKVAQCIANYAEIEVSLGAFLGFILHTNEKAAVAMYSGLENRSAQLRMITSAAEANLPTEHFEVISALISSILRPAMRTRDKLAHWNWGSSEQLPEALLVQRPQATLGGLMKALSQQRRNEG